MFVVEGTVEIDRPAAEVFAFVSDLTNGPQWQTDLHAVHRDPPGPVRVGSVHVFERRFAGRTVRSHSQVTAYDPPRRIELSIPEGWIGGTFAYEVEPTATGSRMTCRMEFEGRGLARAFEPLLRRVMEHDTRRDDARLKALLESRPTADVPARGPAAAAEPAD